MPNISDLIKTRAHMSPVDIICEADPNHLSHMYVEIVVKGPHGQLVNADGSTYDVPALHMKVCSVCWVKFMQSLNTTLQEMNQLQTKYGGR